MKEIVITPLGTVSPYTKDNCNCPGYLVNYGENRILLDCGNGITRLLHFPDDLNKLSVIITHYHKDHFGDIGALQYASMVYHNLGLLKKPIKIYLPKKDIDYSKKNITASKDFFVEYIDITEGLSFTIDDLEITLHDNKSHVIESFMVKLQNGQLKVIYTSDIGVTNRDDLIAFCQDADMIISESSLLLANKSPLKTHLTAYDAAINAKDAHAKKLLLTHFWPEEDKKAYLEEARKVFSNTSVAEEGKRLILK